MSRKGCVYAIGVDWSEPFKIGVAENVAKRLEKLQGANHQLLKVLWNSEGFDDPYAVEAALHEHFKVHRVRGEWFAVPGADAELLRATTARLSADAVSRRFVPRTAECSAVIEALRLLVMRRQRIALMSAQDAIGAIAADAGLGRSTVWGLLYRPPADLYVSPYLAIANLVAREAGKDPFEEVPSALLLRLVLEQLKAMTPVMAAEAALGIAPGRTGTEG